MAIYHFSAKVISRANGSSAVAAAAYRSASRLHDERLDRAHDFTGKAGVVHSEILAPEGVPKRWQDRAGLWNEVEAAEKRKDAQLAREVEFAIPREMSQAQGVALAQDFVQREFVGRGMVADLNVHWDVAEDGSPKPHAHVMLSLREAGAGGFGAKVRDWNSTELLEHWREAWGGHVNQRLAELGIDARIDHRSLKDQQIDLEPQQKIGAAGARRNARGQAAERAEDHHAIASRNGERIIAEPSVALSAITLQQSTFTEHDLMRFVHRHSDDAEQFSRALAAVKASPEMVALGRDGAGRERFSTRELIAAERRMETSAQQLAERRGPGVSPSARARALAAGMRRGLTLGDGQRDALRHVTGDRDLSLVVGYAGSGKSAMLGVAREAWEASGRQVRGAALSGIAAESLEGGSGIASRTLASLEHAWAQGRELLTPRDVLVIDEAGMIGSRQMERILGKAEIAGAKVVLVGDAEQLQAIEAGAAFRALTERHGAAEITEIRRQREGWQREATRELATGRTDAALARYEAVGMVQGHATREAAREAVVAGWDAARLSSPEATQLMLAHTRDDVAELNRLAGQHMRQAGDLGIDHVVMTERGERDFAAGDRLMFLRNERSLGVKNGTLGTVERIEGSRLKVRVDGVRGEGVVFDVKDYADIDHGYASTIHKSQGVTVDNAHVLASGGLDRHAAYVAMSRHRDTLAVHWGADDFRDRAQLVRTLGRERGKDTSLDYRELFAERRGFVQASLELRNAAVQRSASLFAGFKPLPRDGRAAAAHALSTPILPRGGLDGGIRSYALAVVDIERMATNWLPVLPHQKAALQRAERRLETVDLEVAHDLRSALTRRPGLAKEVERPGGLEKLKRAIAREAAVRRDPALRADRFVEDWKRLEAREAQHSKSNDPGGLRQVQTRMARLAAGLERDPPVAEVLSQRRAELGLSRRPEVGSLAQELLRSLGRGQGPELER